MHLTSSEDADGVYIANMLFNEGFTGKILIASASSEDDLERFAEQITGNVSIPGKDIQRIAKCLEEFGV